jgi:hypothetical protein
MSDTAPSPDLYPQIHQDVKGYKNQTIGKVLGGVVVNNLTIYERVPETSAPPPISVEQPLTQQEYRQRKVLLDGVKASWVKGFLETSLHARVLIALGLQERLDLVQRPFSCVAEFSDTPGQSFPEGTQATNVFEQLGTGRTLLILGEPGSGKTISLLKLAEDLIFRTEQDLRQPIPVVFNLSSWARKPQTIAKWLVQELLEKYHVSKALGKHWVETEALILLLDGLDEVKAEQRNACVQALNQFMQTHGITEIAICCRIRDYQALKDRLILRSAVCIQPLTLDQINFYFDQAGEQLCTLKTVLQQDKEWQKLATSPLMLSIMSLAYQDLMPEQFTLNSNTESYRKHLFETYIERMFQRRGATQRYPRMKIQWWLIWLAQRMLIASQSEFLIERLQPSWLSTKKQRFQFGIISGLTSGLIFGFGIFTLMNGLKVELKYGQKSGIIAGIFGGLIYGLMIGFLREIKPVETLRWSWSSALKGFRNALIIVLIFVLLFVIVNGLINGLNSKLISGLIDRLLLGLVMAALFGGLIGGFQGPEIQEKGKPNQSIINSARNGSFLGLGIFLIIFGLFVVLSTIGLTNSPNSWLFYALLGGLIGGLIGGGNACLRHFALRFTLHRLGYAPWNYAHFLDYATERLFLQKVGGGYIFVHRTLLEYFAAMPFDRGQR